MRKDSVSLRELCYYLFFGLMIAAKGMGLDSGDGLYYALSAAALFCVVCKLCLTRYTRRELALTILLCLLSFAAWRNSGRLGIVLSVLAVVGMKDIEPCRLFRTGLLLFGAAFFLTVCLAASGVIPNPLVVHAKGKLGEVIRWGMGFSTGNVFHISYFIFAVLFAYHRGRRYGIKNMLWLMGGNLLVFVFSLSYTGVAVTACYLLLNLYAVRRTNFNRAERVLCRLPLPLCLLFSFGAPFLLPFPLGQKLNVLLQARPAFSYYYLTSQPITLFGNRMKDVPNFWIIMDNGYVYILMTFGVIAFLLFTGAYAMLIERYVKKSAGAELAVIFSFLLYGIMEQFISNAFMNVSIFFMGALLFHKEEKTEKAVLGQGEQEKAALGDEMPGQAVTRDGASEKAAVREGNPENTAPGDRKHGKMSFWEKEAPLPGWLGRTGDRRMMLWRTGTSPDSSSGALSRGAEAGMEKGSGRIAFAVEGIRERKRSIAVFGCAAGALLCICYFVFSERPVYVTVPASALPSVDAQSVLVHTNLPCESEEELKSLMERYGEAVCEKAREAGGRTEELLEFSLPQSVYEMEDYRTFRIRLLQGVCGMAQEDYRTLLEKLLSETVGEREELGLKADAVYAEQVGKDFGTDRIEHMKDAGSYMIEKDGNIVNVEIARSVILVLLAGTVMGCAAAGAAAVGRSRRR